MFSPFSITVHPSKALRIDKETYSLSFKTINHDFFRTHMNQGIQEFSIGEYTGLFGFKGSEINGQVTDVTASFTISSEPFYDRYGIPAWRLDKSIKVSIVGEDKEKIKWVDCERETSELLGTNSRSVITYKASIKLDNLLIYELTNNSCCCNLEFLIEINSTTSIEPKKIILPESNLQKKLPELFENEKFGDVVLEVKGVKLRAHKMLLAAQSSVFATMFEQKGMTETEENLVKIDDMEPDVARQMLEFVYIDREPSKMSEYANELIPVAHKYEMYLLNVMCQAVLMKNITRENALKNMLLAKMYDAEILTQAVIDFIKQNSTLLDSAEFKEFDINHQEIAIQIYREMLKRK